MGLYISQKTTQYLNMYLVIEKPEPTEAGISIVGFDHIRARSPELYNLLVGNAASNIDPVDKCCMLFENHNTIDRYYTLEFQLDEIGCTPRLVPGDLLILRGDIPHRTQFPIR